MRLRAQVVNFIGLDLLQDTGEVGTVGQVAIVQDKSLVMGVWVFINVIDALSVEQRRPALDAMYFVAFFQ